MNTHGLKIEGLRTACTATKKLTGAGAVLYDTQAGRVLVVDAGEETPPSMERVHVTTEPMTQQAIADLVAAAVADGKLFAAGKLDALHFMEDARAGTLDAAELAKVIAGS